MSRIDLHIHTTYSDGTLTPQQVVAIAAERGVSLIAITDHDELGGILPAQEAGRELGVEVLSGVEINTEVGREDVHVLGYGFHVDSPVMHRELQALRDARVTRAMRMVERLATLGFPLDPARVTDIAGHGSIGRPHLARALVEAGYARDYAEAFDRFIGSRCPAYVPHMKFTPEAAVDLIHRAGGIASLAHPGKLGDPLRIIHRLVGAGLDALEAYHSDHQPAVTERMLKYAHQFGLAVTGGTDSHGPDGTRSVTIGALPIPDEVGETVKRRIAERQWAEE
jgi:predicted metal-dependent phosphoesterase TrpH